MSSRKIRSVLKKKGYKLLDIRVLPWTWQGETEWLIKIPKEQIDFILSMNTEYFCKSYFDSDGYFGGNSEVIEESLEFLPQFKKPTNTIDSFIASGGLF